jgi:hypothetical protein
LQLSLGGFHCGPQIHARAQFRAALPLLRIELGDEPLAVDRFTGILRRQADHDIAQLAHVAWKRVVHPQLLSACIEHELRAASLLGIELGKVRQQASFVLAQIAQRRYRYREYAQSMIKIGTKAPGLYFLSQVAVGGGDHPRVALPALRLAQTLILAVFQTRNNFACSSNGSSPISSRNKVRRARLRKYPARAAERPVKAPFACPKTVASTRFGDIARKLSARYGFMRACALPMQRGGNELFAAARFTFDQHGKRRIAILAYLLLELAMAGPGR